MKTVAAVALALKLLHPGMPAEVRASYAAETVRAAERAKIDPLVIVALAEHESRWRPSVVGGMGGQCIGLGQVCLHFQPQCKGGDFTTAGCLRRKEELRGAAANLRWVGGALGAIRSLCKRVIRREPTAAEILMSYGGYDKPGELCGHARRGKAKASRIARGVSDILAIRARLRKGTAK